MTVVTIIKNEKLGQISLGTRAERTFWFVTSDAVIQCGIKFLRGSSYCSSTYKTDDTTNNFVIVHLLNWQKFYIKQPLNDGFHVGFHLCQNFKKKYNFKHSIKPMSTQRIHVHIYLRRCSSKKN